MKISVVMATYNGEQFLREQLDSIRLQTRTVGELIMCDDGSTDRTVAIAEEYIEEYNLGNCWKMVVNEKNLGYANNFNKVTLLATGDLIFFADQDDVWNEDKVQIMTDIMEGHKDCQVLCTDYVPWFYGDNAQDAPKKVLDKMPDNGVLEKIAITPKSLYIGAIGCCMCVRREFYHSIKKYWFDGWAQDDRMWKLAQCADGCYILHKNLIKHRLHGNNTSTYGKYHTVEKRVKLFEHMLHANEKMKEMLEDKEARQKEVRIVEKHIHMMKNRISLLRDRKILKSVKLLGYLGFYQNLKSYLVEIYLVVVNRSR